MFTLRGAHLWRQFGFLALSSLGLSERALTAPGFLAIDTLPAHFQHLKSSIFRLILYSPNPEWIIPPQQHDEYRAFLKNLQSPVRESKEFEFKNFSQPGKLFRSYVAGYGTAFLWRDQKTLLTTRHTFSGMGAFPREFYNATNAEEVNASIRNLRPQLVILNHHGEMIFSTREESFSGRPPRRFPLGIGFPGHPLLLGPLHPAFQNLDSSTLTELSDFIELRIAKAIPARPLVFSTNEILPGTPLLSLSYPHPTHSRMQENHARDAPGEGLQISTGNAIAVPEFYLSFLRRIVTDSAAIDAYTSQRIFSNLDMVGGSSGAPIFGMKGELVGLYGAHWNNGQRSLESSYYPGGGHGACARFLEKVLKSGS